MALLKNDKLYKYIGVNCKLPTDLGVPQATQGSGSFRAALRSGTDEGSVLNPYNP
ncbi:hypothetical protein [Pedobacter sp. KACC 23697]|uniref:Uncharacterized protein n=1 Tax=Pedobacter sp. KACC 23697 TaxID=3149230 RepID=A0AAU7K4F2_9SPHI